MDLRCACASAKHAGGFRSCLQWRTPRFPSCGSMARSGACFAIRFGCRLLSWRRALGCWRLSQPSGQARVSTHHEPFGPPVRASGFVEAIVFKRSSLQRNCARKGLRAFDNINAAPPTILQEFDSQGKPFIAISFRADPVFGRNEQGPLRTGADRAGLDHGLRYLTPQDAMMS